MPLRFS